MIAEDFFTAPLYVSFPRAREHSDVCVINQASFRQSLNHLITLTDNRERITQGVIFQTSHSAHRWDEIQRLMRAKDTCSSVEMLICHQTTSEKFKRILNFGNFMWDNAQEHDTVCGSSPLSCGRCYLSANAIWWEHVASGPGTPGTYCFPPPHTAPSPECSYWLQAERETVRGAGGCFHGN